MKVLLAGMNIPQNQFRRQIEAYGCEVVHISGDPGGYIPTECDAAVIAKCHISHAKFNQVKNLYADLRKPIFAAHNGFSQIKERFEDFVAQKLAEERAKQEALKPKEKPTQWVTRKPGSENSWHPQIVGQTENGKIKTEEAVAMQTQQDKGPKKRALHDRETIARIEKIVSDCTYAGMSHADTVEMLEAEGLRKASGEKFTNQDVSGVRYKLGITKVKVPRSNNDASAPAAPIVQEAPKPQAPVVEVRTPIQESVAVPAPAADANVRLKLIGDVLSSTLPQDKKLRLVARIQAGEVNEVETIECQQVSTDFGPKLRISVRNILSDRIDVIATLTKDEARALHRASEQIKRFGEIQ